MLIGFLSIILILSNMAVKKSKIMYAIIFVWMWLLMAGTYGIADEGLYISRYTTPKIWTSTTEFLYNWIILFFNGLGMNFITFKVAITFIQLMLIYVTMWRLATYPNLVIALYFLFPFPLHIAQMRSALATSIFIWGTRYLIDDCGEIKIKKLKLTAGDIKFIITVLIASCIHTASVGWLILLVAKKMDLRFNIIFAFILNFLVYFILTPDNILNVINIFGGNTRISAYFSEAYQSSAARQYGNLIGVLFTAVAMILLCIYMYNRKKCFVNIRQTEFLLKSNIIILFIISIILKYTGEAYRLQEGLAVLNLLLISNSINPSKFKLSHISKDNCIVYFGLSMYVIGIFGIRLMRYLIPTIILPILQNNRFLAF